MIDYLALFILFFAVIDPIGTVPVFLAVTRTYDSIDKRKIALKATLIAAAVLIFFVSVGEVILDSIGIELAAFQIAGGIVLFLFALSMIFGDSKPDEEIKNIKSNSEAAIFPLAIPSIASPGAMLAAVMQTQNTVLTVDQQILVTLVILSVLLVALVLMLGGTLVDRLIGKGGASVISRIMGLILASVAVQAVLTGISVYFSL